MVQLIMGVAWFAKPPHLLEVDAVLRKRFADTIYFSTWNMRLRVALEPHSFDKYHGSRQFNLALFFIIFAVK